MLRHMKAGFRKLRKHKKTLLLLYLGNLTAALLLAVPFMEVFEDSLGAGLYRERLEGSLDYEWYRLFQERTSGFASTFSPAVIGVGPFVQQLERLLDGELAELPAGILMLGGLYLLAHSFLMAAALGSLVLDPGGTTTREFFRTGAVLFGRFFRLSLLGLVCLWLLDRWVIDPSEGWVAERADAALTDRSAFYWRFSRYPLLLVLFLNLNMVLDYSKIKTALEDRTSVLLAFLSALRFCLGRWASSFGLYLLLTGVGIAGAAAYVSLDGRLPQQTGITILIAFLLQQTYMLFRLSVKLLFYSVQTEFYLATEFPPADAGKRFPRAGLPGPR